LDKSEGRIRTGNREDQEADELRQLIWLQFCMKNSSGDTQDKYSLSRAFALISEYPARDLSKVLHGKRKHPTPQATVKSTSFFRKNRMA
jgi:hypothetical protein